ncbi:MAG: flagellar hook-associated protein FlgK [Sedimentisphaerales bacterium]|nr:flagellar hook-associated protein FlgK [Sedimentisphaerales bacterium]
MSNYSIGISGLNAAERALDVIGNNIANAATEGYHRQRIELSPDIPSREGAFLFGTGVDIDGVRRIIDNLLEKEILRQGSLSEQVDRELATLRTIESALGELSSEEGGLNAAIDKFFNSLQDLSAHPGDAVWQNQAVSDASAMTSQFRTMGSFLSTLEDQLRLETVNTVESVNALTAQIAELNGRIQQTEVGGGQANNLRDQRDKLISDLAELASIETQSRPYGVVDVVCAGIPVVMGTTNLGIEAGLDSSGELGISVAGASNYTTRISGGQIGGLLSLRNEHVSDLQADLDSLATAIIQEINKLHVQGVGSAGSFTGLTGRRMESEDLSDMVSSVVDGTIYIRVTNSNSGAVTRSAITIDRSADSLTSIASDISAITGLSASVASSRLSISADSGYTFDFLPSVLSSPTASTLTGSAPAVSVSGIYTGTSNDTFTFTVSGTGSVGNGTLQLVATDSGGSTVATLNVGSGYAAGDKLEVGNGIRIALGTGDMNAGETFSVDAFGNTDTSRVLAAIGINTFLSGSGAVDMAVCSDISASPGRLAVALGAEMEDNRNAIRMAGVKDQAVSDLTSLTCGEFYRKVVTGIGQKISMREISQDNVKQMVQNLAGRQSEASGVDINEEAAELLVYEQMFQAMAKYMNTVQVSMTSLMDLL